MSLSVLVLSASNLDDKEKDNLFTVVSLEGKYVATFSMNLKFSNQSTSYL